MKIQLTQIAILQSAKIVTALNAILGLLYTFVGILFIIFGNAQYKIIGGVYLFGPVFTAAFGFLGFCFIGCAYNAMARHLGGVEFQVKIQAPPIDPALTS